jgi:putative ABC transport system permease protein
LTSLGTLPKQIFFLVMAEACVLSLCASVVAILLGVPIVYYLKHYGIDFSGIVQQISFAGINLSARAYGAMGPSQILTPLVFLLMVIPLASLLPALKAKNQDNLPNGI